MDIEKVKEKEKLIKSELAQYKKIFKNLEKDKKKLAEKVYYQAVFMDVTLKELQEAVICKGAIIDAINGNGFEVNGENPAQKSYNNMVKNYNSAIKTLNELLPNEKEGPDDLEKFMKAYESL